MARDLTLVVGATGLLGDEILRLLRADGRAVRALVRPSAADAKRDAIRASGAEVTAGDLKDERSLRAACEGVTTVVSTATATRSRQSGDTIATVDEDGQLALVATATGAGVAHFTFVSFPPLPVDYALQRAKRRVEAAVRASGMSFTILQPVKFCEVWLSPFMRAESANGRPTVFGLSEGQVSWICVRDVARFAVASVKRSRLAGRTIPLGGPDALSPREVATLFDDLGAPPIASARVTRGDCTLMLNSAKTPYEEAYFAGLLSCALGQVVDPAPAAALLEGGMKTVRDFAAGVVGANSNGARG